VTRNLTLHYDRMMLILDPTPLTRGLVRKKVEVVNYPDGRFAVQFNGATLGFKLFDKIQTMQPGAIVDNKRLSAVFEQVKAQQAAYPARQQRGHVARQRPPNNLEGVVRAQRLSRSHCRSRRTCRGYRPARPARHRPRTRDADAFCRIRAAKSPAAAFLVSAERASGASAVRWHRGRSRPHQRAPPPPAGDPRPSGPPSMEQAKRRTRCGRDVRFRLATIVCPVAEREASGSPEGIFPGSAGGPMTNCGCCPARRRSRGLQKTNCDGALSSARKSLAFIPRIMSRGAADFIRYSSGRREL
jgi:hypothetical protein